MSAPWDDRGQALIWAECDDCKRRSWCLREDDDLTYCADEKACQRRLRRQPHYWLSYCRMRWRALVTYPREGRRPQPPAPWERDAPPWAREGGEDR